MADPISITGLVVGVSQVIFAAAKYAGQVKQADDDIEALLKELLELKGVLVQIQSQPNSTDSTLQETLRSPASENILRTCHECVQELLEKLQAKSGSVKGKIQKFVWPFSKDSLSERITKLERIKSGLILMIVSVLTSSSNSILTKLSKVMETLTKDLEDRDMQARREMRRKIFEKLAPVDPELTHARCLGLTHPGTGEWFLKGPFEQWLRMLPRKRVLWLCGKSGAGKTILFSNAVERLRRTKGSQDNIASAYFYCAFDDASSQDPIFILGSYLIQLFSCRPDLYQANEAALQSCEPTASDILELLQQCCKNYAEVYLFLDALNESAQGEKILKAFHKLICSSHNVYIVLTSINNDTSCDDNLKNELKVINFNAIEQRKDFDTYIGARIATSPKLADLDEDLQKSIHDTLLRDANGM